MVRLGGARVSRKCPAGGYRPLFGADSGTTPDLALAWTSDQPRESRLAAQKSFRVGGLERRGWLHQRSPQSGSVGVSLSLGLHRVLSTLGELSSADQIPDCLAVTDAGQHWRCIAMAVRYRSLRGQRQCQTGGQGNALRSRRYRGPR